MGLGKKLSQRTKQKLSTFLRAGEGYQKISKCLPRQLSSERTKETKMLTKNKGKIAEKKIA